MKSDIHNKDFARTLTLKERLTGLGKWPIVCVWMEKGCRELATKKLTRVLFFRDSEKYQILTRRGNDEKNAVEIASSHPPTALITILSRRVRHCDLFLCVVCRY